jgi:DNA-binding NtrC family response regulator
MPFYLAGQALGLSGRSRPKESTAPFESVRWNGYPWPGNVRELENAIERAVAVWRGEKIQLRDLPPDVKGTQEEGSIPAEQLAKMPYREAVDLARDRVTRDYLVALLRDMDGNVTQAATRAGMARESLHRLLKRYGVRSDDFKER